MARTGEGKTAVVGWGRGMGHKGHMYLASSVITHANQLGADPYFVVSKTVGKDDPITPDEKIAIYKKVFPQSGHIFQPATDEIPDLTRVLANLNQQGYTGVTVVLGADQVKAFQYLKNYNNKPDKSGNILYNFDNLDVISRQETDDPSKDQEGPRATPMRQALMDPNKSEEEQFQVWRDAMSPQIGDDEVRDLMTKAKERMGQFSAPKPKKAAKAEPVNELSSEKLGQYKKAAGAQASAADKAGDTKKADKRFSGIVKATKKQFANDKKGVGEARKKKSRSKNKLSNYFFPGYGYYGYGGSNDSGEGGGDGGGEGLNEDDVRAEAQAAYMQGQCMILAIAINQLNPKRYPIGYIWEYNMSAGAPDMEMDDDEWEYLSPEEQEEISKDISRHSVVHAYVQDQETNEYIDARGRHRTLPNLWGSLGVTRFDEFPGTARELIDITAHGDWDEASEQVSFKRGRPAFDSLAGPAGVKRAQDYAVKYLGVEGSKNKAPGTDQQGVAEGAPIVVMPRADRLKKAEPTKVRYQGDIIPPTQPPSTEKRGVKGRPGQRPMPKYDVEEAKKKGADGKACWDNYRYNGTKNGKDSCVKVSEGVEDIMDALINKIITNEAIQNNRK